MNTVINPFTFATRSMTSLVDVGILRRIFVTFWAMRNRSFLLSGQSTNNIQRVENRLKMSWIYTTTVTAEISARARLSVTRMVEFISCRDRTDIELIRDDVSLRCSPGSTANSEVGVSVRSQRSGPKPASGNWVDFNLAGNPVVNRNAAAFFGAVNISTATDQSTAGRARFVSLDSSHVISQEDLWSGLRDVCSIVAGRIYFNPARAI